MELQEKVKSLPHVCGIELDFDGQLIPSAGEELINFYNSYPSNNEFVKAYFGLKTVRFKESSVDTRSGVYFNQGLVIQFPSNDVNRSSRLDLFKKVKFIKIKLTNNTEMVFGRNDYFQNKKPEVKIESDLNISKVTFSTKSIFPLGFLIVDMGAVGFPVDVPIDFINLI